MNPNDEPKTAGTFLLFAGEDYEANGGWEDFAGQFPTLAAAEAHAATIFCDWWHVVQVGAVSTMVARNRNPT